MGTEYAIFVGAAHWRHAHWQKTFYPEELPEDWELSFYNSQFRCVYLPHSYWQNLSLPVAETWLADTQPNFRFILEQPGTLDENAALFLRTMGKRAVLECPDPASLRLIWFPAQPDLRNLAREIEQAIVRGNELYLLNREACLPAMEQLKSLVEVMGY